MKTNVLKIRNFGPIKEADININKYNIFIGHTSSGKSIAAKLITIFNDIECWTIKNGDFQSFRKILKKYNIDYAFEEDTVIEFENEKLNWTIKRNSLVTNNEDYDLMNFVNEGKDNEFLQKFKEKKKEDKAYSELLTKMEELFSLPGINKDNNLTKMLESSLKEALLHTIYNKLTPLYIPAERILISMFSNSVFSLLEAGASIPECIKRFGSQYEKARIENKSLDIDIMNIRVTFSDKEDTIFIKDSNTTINITQASSGIQSIIPLWAVFNENIKNTREQIIVIEEPELNLFPTAQVSLVNWIMQKMRKANRNIVITTHSPYVLSTLDNLVLAYDIYKRAGKNKLVHNKIKKLIPTMALLNLKDVSSYFFDNNGIVRNILDQELRTTGAENIDSASNELGYIFEELCNIERNEL